MKTEVRLLRARGIESLVLSIELFNRPSDAGRTHGVLILLDHAFEMLFKAAILAGWTCQHFWILRDNRLRR